jgi:hypothetical protein
LHALNSSSRPESPDATSYRPDQRDNAENEKRQVNLVVQFCTRVIAPRSRQGEHEKSQSHALGSPMVHGLAERVPSTSPLVLVIELRRLGSLGHDVFVKAGGKGTPNEAHKAYRTA